MKSQLSPHRGSSPILLGRESMLSIRSMSRRQERRGWEWQRWTGREKSHWVAGALMLGPVIYTLFVTFSAQPVYRAEATLLIDSHFNRSPSGYTQITQNTQDPQPTDYETEYALLKNQSLASVVLREHELNSVPAFNENSTQDVPAQLIEAYLNNLEVIPVLGTRLVKIAFSAHDPQLAAEIVNTHVAASINQSREPGQNGHPRNASLSLVDKALPAARPLFPRISVGSLFGMLLGFMSGGGLLYWSKRSDHTLKTPVDVTRHLNLATLGIVPDFSTEEVRTEGSQPLPSQFESFPGVFPKELFLSYHPLSLVPEAYRNLRAELLLSRSSGPPRLLLVTSSVSGEGKTLTTLNTGISLAQMGARVLVIDADLRHPHCHVVLKTAKGSGLAEFLAGQRQLAEVIQTTRVERLFFLSAGMVPTNPAELLGSKRMHAALSFLMHMYDYVVIDSPPLGLVSDALLIAPLVDGLVLAVNSQTTDYKIVQEALLRLAHVKQKVLGVVLNKVDVQSREYSDYYRRYRAYYRQAGEREGDPPPLEMANHTFGSTQPHAVPSKKARKGSKKVEKREEPRLLGNSTPQAEQAKNMSTQKVVQAEEIPSTHTSLTEKTEDNRNGSLQSL